MAEKQDETIFDKIRRKQTEKEQAKQTKPDEIDRRFGRNSADNKEGDIRQ